MLHMIKPSDILDTVKLKIENQMNEPEKYNRKPEFIRFKLPLSARTSLTSIDFKKYAIASTITTRDSNDFVYVLKV